MDESRDEHEPTAATEATGARAARSARSADAAAAAAEKKRNENVGVGVVFALVGVALFLTLDSPWAGLPMVVVGAVLVGMAMKGSRRQAPDAGPTPDDRDASRT
jgi:hypothetical protein